MILSMIGRDCRLGFLMRTVYRLLRSTRDVTLAWPTLKDGEVIPGNDQNNVTANRVQRRLRNCAGTSRLTLPKSVAQR